MESQPSCVMQIEPQPIPTLNASTPASIRFFAWAAVTTTERTETEVGEQEWATEVFARDSISIHIYHSLPQPVDLGTSA